MKPNWIFVICLAGGMTAGAGASAQAIGQEAAHRHPPDPAAVTLKADVEPATPSTRVRIEPTGIMSILGRPQVLFTTTDSQGGETNSYLLNEGQLADGIKVVHIDQAASLITFDNHGVRQDLVLSQASVHTPAASAADGAPQAFPHPQIPRPSGLGSGLPPYLGGDESTGQGESTPLTHDDQVLMIEAQRAYYRSQGDPESLRLANALPPTAMTPDDAFDSSPAVNPAPPQPVEP